MVPESYGLFQLLHRAITYDSTSCLYLIINYTILMYVLHVTFLGELLSSYLSISWHVLKVGSHRISKLNIYDVAPKATSQITE